jgi:hypothetical protein
MAYIGGGAQPTIDWEARDEIYKLNRTVDELRQLLVELITPEQRDRLLERHAKRGAYCAYDGVVYPCPMVRALGADELVGEQA